MDWTDPTGAVRTTLPVDHLGTTPPTSATMPGDHRNNWVRSSPSDAQDQEAGLGDAAWDGDYWNPNAYTGGPARWLQDELDLAAGFRAPDHRSPSVLAVRQEPTSLELRCGNLLGAKHNLTQHQELGNVEGRDIRWLDQGRHRWELADLEPEQPAGSNEPPF